VSVGPAGVEDAAGRIAGRVRTTPALELEPDALDLPFPITIKLELCQRTGSFKLRGAFNALLGGSVPEAGIVAASGGNFGVAIATAATDLGIPAAVFVPEAFPRSSPARAPVLASSRPPSRASTRSWSRSAAGACARAWRPGTGPARASSRSSRPRRPPTRARSIAGSP